MGQIEQTAPDRRWWHSAVVYQIYPASFKDGNGDGLGDLRGIISKVDYIVSLGVATVWMSPCHKSPRNDQGYDISDYTDIDSNFGSVQDVEELIKKLKERNIKLLMDLVVNHTSDEHPWFYDSKSSNTSPKRHWYIWRKGKPAEVGHEPPNNWESHFKGSAWKYDQHTGEYYLHLFDQSQPDLNWENPDVRHAVYDIMRFWLDKGIGGFRMDVINMTSKPVALQDAPVSSDDTRHFVPADQLYCDGPRVHEYLREMRAEVLDKYPDSMVVGETPIITDPRVIRKFVSKDRGELDMALQYDLMDMDHGKTADGLLNKFLPSYWRPVDLKRAIVKWQQALAFSSKAWQAGFFESHDSGRSVSRFGDGSAKNRIKVAKTLAMLQTTLQGTQFVYQGQELGMINLQEGIKLDEFRDVETKNYLDDLRKMKESTLGGVTLEEALQQVRLKARDNTRMPMPWHSTEKHGGFSDAGEPWTRLNTDLEICNVAQQESDQESVLNFWRTMLVIRREYAEALVFGDFGPLLIDDGPVFAYRRVPADDGKDLIPSIVVVLNMTKDDQVPFEMPKGDKKYRSLHSTTTKTEEMKGPRDKLVLSAFEGMMLVEV